MGGGGLVVSLIIYIFSFIYTDGGWWWYAWDSVMRIHIYPLYTYIPTLIMLSSVRAMACGVDVGLQTRRSTTAASSDSSSGVSAFLEEEKL